MSSTKKTEYVLSALYETAITGKGNPVKHKTKYIWPNIEQALRKKYKRYISRRYSYTKI